MIPCIESVTAERILDLICDPVSVKRMRDAVSGEDLDIFDDGSLRDNIRFEGAFEEMVNNNKYEWKYTTLTIHSYRKRE